MFRSLPASKIKSLLACRLEVFVTRLPEQKRELPGEILERHDLFFGEVPIIVVDLQQKRFA